MSEASDKARAQRELDEARQLFAEGRRLASLAACERALELDREAPAAVSFYAMLIALERGQVRRGLELSQEAMEKIPEDPEAYLNLARIYLKDGRKQEAVHCLNAGLEREPQHKGLLGELKRLGIRKDPVLGFLPRSHPLNRWLGRLRHRWQTR